MMHVRTEATLQQLAANDWFRNVGALDTDSATVLQSWEQAIESCSGAEWEELCLEAANQHRARLIERSADSLLRWNDVVEDVKPSVVKLVKEKTYKIVEKNHLPKLFVDTVNWDILHLCMESEFSDIYPPGFYASQAYWYAGGHFPCGWIGPFPNGGRLVIY
jgi:predicted protein tyrosine phosphatase